jgi:outer membrane protein
MKRQNKFLKSLLIFVVALITSMGITTIGLAENVSPLKIGFVDINKIMKESKAAKSAQAILQKDIDSKKATIKEKSDKLAKMDKDLKNAKQDSPAWKAKREKIDQEIKEFNRTRQEFDEQIRKKDDELTRKIIAEIQQILNKIAKSEKYSIILDKKAALVTEDGLDITAQVMQTYDSQNK